MPSTTTVDHDDVRGRRGVQALSRKGSFARLVFAVLCRPFLWGAALRAVVRLAPRHWWRRWPFLPMPDRQYLAFRVQTQYGGTGTNAFEPSDVLKYLRWLRRSK